MGVSVAVGEVDIEIFQWPRDLFLESTLFLFNFNDGLMGGPVTLDTLQSLLEEKWQVHCLLTGDGEAFEIDMAVVLGELLEKHSLEVIFVESLDEALLVVAQLGENILVEPNAGLLVIDRG